MGGAPLLFTDKLENKNVSFIVFLKYAVQLNNFVTHTVDVGIFMVVCYFSPLACRG